MSYPNVFVRLHGNVIDSLSITSMMWTESLASLRESALIKAFNGEKKKIVREKNVKKLKILSFMNIRMSYEE